MPILRGELEEVVSPSVVPKGFLRVACKHVVGKVPPSYLNQRSKLEEGNALTLLHWLQPDNDLAPMPSRAHLPNMPHPWLYLFSEAQARR